MESLAARRASKHGYKKKKLQLSPEVTNSETLVTCLCTFSFLYERQGGILCKGKIEIFKQKKKAVVH